MPLADMSASVRQWVRAHPVTTVFVVALVARAAVAVISFVAHDVLIPDEAQYIELATTVAAGRPAESWFPGFGQSLYNSTWLFTAPLRFLFEHIVVSRLVGQFYAAMWGAGTAALTTVLALRIISRPRAMAAGAVVALMPSQVVFSSVVLREALVWAGLATVALGVALAAKQQGAGLAAPAVVVALGLLGLGELRIQTALAAGWSVAAAGVVLGGPGRWVRASGATALAVLVPIAAAAGPGGLYVAQKYLPILGTTRTHMAIEANSAFVPTTLIRPPTSVPQAAAAPGTSRPVPGERPGETSTTPRGPGRGGGDEGGATRPDPGGSPRDEGVDGESTGGETATPAEGERWTRGFVPPLASPSHSVIRTPKGAVYVADESVEGTLAQGPQALVAVIFRPFPWEASQSTPLLLARLENAVWYLLYGLAAVGVVRARRDLGTLLFPLTVTAAIFLIGAASQGNLGTAFRHRGQVLWAVALLAAYGAHSLSGRRSAAPSAEAAR